jgi:DegV family protein with EDD domain
MNTDTSTSIAYLDGVRFSRALRAGIARVLSRQDYLNKINVFPVPDGDTGTNIAYTLQTVASALNARVDRHIGNTLTRIADSALDGARGNSGAILAQFFQGLSDAGGSYRVLNTARFTRAMRAGADYARDALTEPKEGTILSVITDFALELESQMTQVGHADFVALLESGLSRAEASVANTPNQMEVLRKAGVVDAGGQGFVDMLAGAVDYMRQGSIREQADLDSIEIEDSYEASAESEMDLTHRYCTECMVVAEDVDRRKLREEISALGNSLVMAGSRGRVKIHIHVNEPAMLFDICARYGQVSGQKADDMHAQQATTHSARGGVAIISDSGADIPDDDMERLEVHMVPLRVHFRERAYLDKVSLSNDEFYRMLADGGVHPTTSQPPPGDFRRQFQYLSSHYDAVIALTITAQASGTFQSAESAAARVRSDSPVLVVDTKNVSLGQGMLATYAAECVQAGLNSDQVLVALERMIPLTRTFAVLPDMRYVVRGGRVSKGKKALADLLHITPVLATKPDGSIGQGGVLFGRENLVDKFARYLVRRAAAGKRYRVAVGHCNDPGSGNALLERLRAGIPELESALLTEVGSALGVHAGPGGLVVAIQEWVPIPE